MKIIYQKENQYVLCLSRGEELMDSLKQFCRDEQITAGFFQGLGACSYLKLAWYNLETKQFESKEYSELLEIASLTGNIAKLEDQIIVHVHGTFSDKSLIAFAGHIMKLTIGGAGEIRLEKFEAVFKRALDPVTGLNLLA